MKARNVMTLLMFMRASVLKVLKELLLKLSPVRETGTQELSSKPSAEFKSTRSLSSPMHFKRWGGFSAAASELHARRRVSSPSCWGARWMRWTLEDRAYVIISAPVWLCGFYRSWSDSSAIPPSFIRHAFSLSLSAVRPLLSPAQRI